MPSEDGRVAERLRAAAAVESEALRALSGTEARASAPVDVAAHRACVLACAAGAIYTTENAGRNWKAEVRETIDATLNRVSSSGVQGASYFSGSINSIQRDSEGSYLAVSPVQLGVWLVSSGRQAIPRVVAILDEL